MLALKVLVDLKELKIQNLFYIEMTKKYCNKNFKMNETNQKAENAEQLSLSDTWLISCSSTWFHECIISNFQLIRTNLITKEEQSGRTPDWLSTGSGKVEIILETVPTLPLISCNRLGEVSLHKRKIKF